MRVNFLIAVVLALYVVPGDSFGLTDKCRASLVRIDLTDRTALELFYRAYGSRLHDIAEIKLPGGKVVQVEKLASGSHGTVYHRNDARGRRLIKIANGVAAIQSLENERKSYPKISRIGIRVAKIFNSRQKAPLHLEKEFIKGPSALEIRDRNAYTQEMIVDLARKFILAYENEMYIDVFRAENFVWSEEEKTFVLVDAMLRQFEVSFNLNYVNMTDWTQELFSSFADKEAFQKAIRRIKGKAFWDKLQAQQEKASLDAHALKYFEGF